MVTCPRCQQPIDETVRSTCPLCFTPIPQPNVNSSMNASLRSPLPLAGDPGPQDAAAGYAPPAPPPGIPGLPPLPAPQPQAEPPRPLLNPGARVSLTGEVIESGAPQGPPPSYVGGGPGAGPRPGGPPPRPCVGARPGRGQAAEKSSSGNPAGIIIAVLLVIGAAVGGWYYWMHRTNPRDQALSAYKAYLSQDYKSAYALTVLSPDNQKKFPDAETFAVAQANTANAILSSYPGVQDSLKAAASSATVGEPVITGDKADVPTACQISIMGRNVKLAGTAHMVNDSGVWKLDLTNPMQSATALLGKPSL